MRKFVVAAVLAAGVAALATAALGSTKSPSSAAAPANAGSALDQVRQDPLDRR